MPGIVPAPRAAAIEGSGRQPPPALRISNEPDDQDATRATWSWELFQSQDAAYRLRDRSVEKNVRFLAGRQWDVYHPILGWRDITHWMTEEERMWRQRPVFNRILPWFILTHARMTENGFICTFVPGPDREDAMLAEAEDVLYKTKWRELGMTEVWDRCAAWMIVAGAGFIGSRIDPEAGDWKVWKGAADVPLVAADGVTPLMGDNGPQSQFVEKDVPFGPDGAPRAVIREGMGLQLTGEPHRTRKGDLAIDVYSPLEVRGQWGPIPWHKQDRHIIRSYLSPEEVWNRWGVECEPDVRGEAASDAGFLERLLFSSGFYGAASSMQGSDFGGTSQNKDGYVCVQTLWQKPSERVEGMQETPDSPGGRLLVTTRNKTLSDGPRPFAFKYTSPIRCFDFVRLPGRPGGSTPQETMNSPQHAYNTGYKHLFEHRALCTSPQQVYDLRAGLDKQKVDNRPGRRYGVKMRPGVVPIQWITPPAIGADVWRLQQTLGTELEYLGSTHGTQPEQFSKDASGELIKELRFNDDRFLGPTMRRSADEMGRMVNDWRVMWPMLYDVETVIKYTGKDEMARTLVLLPEIFKAGTSTLVPDTESMLPEGRGERRARVYKMWQDGAFGDPKSPGAIRKLHELGNFPQMDRAMRPGGVHWVTASQENGRLIQGEMPDTYQWYDDDVHLICHEEFMSSPEWLRLPDEVKTAFVTHRMVHQQNRARKQALAMQAAAAQQAALTPPSGPGGGPSGSGAAPAAPPQVAPGPPAIPRGIAQMPTAPGVTAASHPSGSTTAVAA